MPLCTKFQDNRSNHSWVIIWKRNSVLAPWWPKNELQRPQNRKELRSNHVLPWCQISYRYVKAFSTYHLETVAAEEAEKKKKRKKKRNSNETIAFRLAVECLMIKSGIGKCDLKKNYTSWCCIHVSYSGIESRSWCVFFFLIWWVPDVCDAPG